MQRGLTHTQVAEALDLEPRDVREIETGATSLDLHQIARIASVLQDPALSPVPRAMHLRIKGPTTLRGSIDVRSSKNGAVAMLCASLLNKGRTILTGVARIEEVNRILEVLESIGMQVSWSDDKSELELVRPEALDLAAMDMDAARRTRSIIMFLGPLLHLVTNFAIPYAGGCDLGSRTVTPHLQALKFFGLDVKATDGWYHAKVRETGGGVRHITLTERGDTVTENVLMAAALHPGTTVIRNASPNYMVQDLCFFLEALGVTIEGLGTTTLTVTGKDEIASDVRLAPSEDPIEAMSLITAAVVTKSELTVRRAPIEFLEVELAILSDMGLRFDLSEEYPGDNGRTRLVDITVYPSELYAARDKIHPMPFPGLNIDNLPFFAVIAAVAQGRTLIHDWVYENRAIHLIDLSKLGANVQLIDPHRLAVEGPTKWRNQTIVCPPALRPAVCLLLASMAADGITVLRDVYVINRGYEDLANRLTRLGANIQVFYD